jgi:hypothetical protein
MGNSLGLGLDLFGSASGISGAVPNNSRTIPEQMEFLNGELGLPAPGTDFDPANLAGTI